MNPPVQKPVYKIDNEFVDSCNMLFPCGSFLLLQSSYKLQIPSPEDGTCTNGPKFEIVEIIKYNDKTYYVGASEDGKTLSTQCNEDTINCCINIIESEGEGVDAGKKNSIQKTVDGKIYFVDKDGNFINLQTPPEPTINNYIANVKEYGAVGDGVTDDTAAFLAAVATLRDVYAPGGDYLLSANILLNAGQTIFGDGYKSNLVTVTQGSVASPDVAYNMISILNNCKVSNLRFTGSGKIAYVFPWTSQNGVEIRGQFGIVENCYFNNLRGSGILSMYYTVALGFGLIFYNRIVNNKFTNCTVGNFSYGNTEYNIYSENVYDNNSFHINEYGANTNYTNCVIINIGEVRVSGNGGNSDRITFTGCSFNHATVINVVNITQGVCFTNCQFLSSNNLNITDSNKVMLIGCSFNALTTININSVAALKTQLLSCYTIDGTAVTVNIAGAAVVTQVNNLF